MRPWVGTLVLMLFAMLLAAAGCSLGHGDGLCMPSDNCFITHQHAAPVCEEICIAQPPAGFTGPSLFWRGAPKDAPTCPPAAPLGGITIYDDPSPAIDPPCAQSAAVEWGFVAHECLVTPETTCPVEGQTCAPIPLPGFTLCVYQDDEAYCPSAYPDPRLMLRQNPDDSCGTMAVQRVTLCCAAAPEPS